MAARQTSRAGGLDGLSVALARIETKVEDVDRRIIEDRGENRGRHADNVVRLDRIEAEVRKTNGRVNTHDAQIAALFSGATESKSQLKIYVTVVMATASVTVGVLLWILKMAGKL